MNQTISQIDEIKSTKQMRLFLEAILFEHGNREANMVNFVFIELAKVEGEIEVANTLLAEVKSGNFVEIKKIAYEFGFVG